MSREPRRRADRAVSRRQSLKIGALAIAGLAARTARPNTSVLADPCVEPVAGTNLDYYLVTFDKNGNELSWTDGTLCSDKAIAKLKDGTVTDVFIFSHGWMGDVPQAKIQYGNWIAAMAACQADIAAMRQARPGFSPLLIGIHWPSLPFGDETLRAALGPADAGRVPIDLLADGIADTRRARQSLERIMAAAEQPPPDRLPNSLVEAFQILPQEAGLRTGGVTAPPGADGDDFDPVALYSDLTLDAQVRSSTRATATSGRNYNLLYMLAILSFWTMKDRARLIGESGGRQLLLNLQSAVTGNQEVRFHLMGHSFGCIVLSAMLQGSSSDRRTPRPISSISLVQGALSHWSFCTNVVGTGTPGYFRSILDRSLVTGPIITTQSQNDTAVRVLYPYAAQFKHQRAMAPSNAPVFPEYGAIGCFGIQGQNSDATPVSLLNVGQPYRFVAGKIYNLECTNVISKMYPISGAHSDIAHPEVAHAIWSAALVSTASPQPSPSPVPSPAPPPRPSPRRRWPLRRLFH
jgi:hypothetical protein